MASLLCGRLFVLLLVMVNFILMESVYRSKFWALTQQTQNVGPVSVDCWATIYISPTLTQYWADVSCFLSTGVTPQIIPPLKLYPGRFWYLPVFWYLPRGRFWIIHRDRFCGSQNLPLPPRIYPPFQDKCLRFPESTLLPEHTPLYNQFICATLPESTPPSQNILPFSTNLYVRPSQNLPLPPRIYPPFQQMYICDPPIIYLSVPEYTPFLTNYMRPSQNLPLPDYTPLFNKCIVRPSQNIPLPLKINPLFNNYVRPSQNMPLPPRIYSSLFNNYNIMRPFQNRPLPPRIYPSIFNNYNIMWPSQNLPIPPGIYLPPFQQMYMCDPPESTPPSQNIPPFQQQYASLSESTPPSQNIPLSTNV